MEYRLTYATRALADLETICGRSWTEHPGRTESFTAGLLDHVELLRAFPYLGAWVPGKKRIRILVHSPFHVYYRVDANLQNVEIIRFWHASRRLPRF